MMNFPPFNRSSRVERRSRRPFTLGLVTMLAAISLLAAACGADHPEDADVATLAPDGTPLCVLQTPTDADVAAAEEAGHAEEPGEGGVDFAVDIEMREFGYSCSLPTIEQGTTLALRFTNVGIVEHEAVVGSLAEQHDAEVQMAEMAAMVEMGLMDSGHEVQGGGHSTPAINVPAGESLTLVVELDEPGEMMIGCHVPGHWAAGMRRNFIVAKAGDMTPGALLG
jgi:uncharacterized cupredoxin-like copper-binding protein